MICASLKSGCYQELMAQMAEVSTDANLLELRLDQLPALDFEKLSVLVSKATLPLILTLRSSHHGGSYNRNEHPYQMDLQRLAALKPAYLDVEADVPASLTAQIQADYSEVKLVVSYHNFQETSHDMDGVLALLHRHKAYWYKIAVKANSCIDMLRLMDWVQDKRNVVAVSMGEEGQASRILGPCLGSNLTFGKSAAETAPGQLSVEMMVNRYRVPLLGRATRLFCLIGDPVSKSLSDRTHNHLIKEMNLNAVYVKVLVRKEEVGDFLTVARKMPFTGMSVTMPLKESVIPYLDEIDAKAQAIGAVNTLHFIDNKIIGYNTDCEGALNAIETKTSVNGKRVVILGAGGAARAVAYEAILRGAEVVIVNRDVDKANALAKAFGCRALALEKMNDCRVEGYDILINTTPVAMPIDSDDVHPGTTVMDIQAGQYMTPLLTAALAKDCQIVPSYKMFVEQAMGQFDVWYGGRLDKGRVRNILDQSALDILQPAAVNSISR